MPIFKYFTWVGAALMAILVISSLHFPQPQARSPSEMTYRIAVRSQARLPEALSFRGDNVTFPQISPVDTKIETSSKNVIERHDAGYHSDNVSTAANSPPKRKRVAKRKPRKQFDQQEVARSIQSERKNVAYSTRFMDGNFFMPSMF